MEPSVRPPFLESALLIYSGFSPPRARIGLVDPEPHAVALYLGQIGSGTEEKFIAVPLTGQREEEVIEAIGIWLTEQGMGDDCYAQIQVLSAHPTLPKQATGHEGLARGIEGSKARVKSLLGMDEYKKYVQPAPRADENAPGVRNG